MTTEGAKALEAAVNEWCARSGLPLEQRMQASIRKWLAALPGWRLVRIAHPDTARNAPSPPGLEQDSEVAE